MSQTNTKSKKKRKTYTSLRDLQADQLKIKNTYEDMEDNMFSSIFDPSSIGLNMVTSLLDPNAKGGIFNLRSIFSLFKRKPKQKAVPAKQANLVAPHSNKPAKKNGFIKKVAVSFVKWQLFNLACWGIEKAYDQCKASRKQKKALKSLQKTTAALEKAIEA